MRDLYLTVWNWWQDRKLLWQVAKSKQAVRETGHVIRP